MTNEAPTRPIKPPPSSARAERMAVRAAELGITLEELYVRERARKSARKQNLRHGDKPPRARSRVTNGVHFLPHVRADSTWVRRAKDVMCQLVADAGGYANMPGAKQLIARRASILEAELLHLETKLAQQGGGAKAEDIDLYCKITNAQRRCLEALGLDRVPRDVTPDLKDYLRATRANSQDAEVETVGRAP